MDPITASIVGALTAGALGGLTEIEKTAISDAYAKLQGLLHKKFGANSGVTQALAQLETKPTSSSRQGVLQEELAAANAWQDAELLDTAKYLQTMIQQRQSISLHRSSVQGSIYQAGHDQYQAGRDQYNIHASGLVGPRAGRTARHVISIVLIIGGLLVSIPAAGVLPFFDSIVNAMIQPPIGGQNGPDFASSTAIANSFGMAAHFIIYTMIGLGIVMVIAGIWLRRNLRKP